MYEYRIRKILKIYDGDTITVELDLGFGVYKKEKLRFAFLDAPEIKGEERPQGLISRDWLRAKINDAVENGHTLKVRTIKDRKGKYGRYLAILFIDNTNINELMLEEGYAKPY